MIKYALLLLIFASCPGKCFSQELKDVNEPIFKVGEELDYRLKYGFFTGAEAIIKVEDGGNKIEGHPTYHIVANGKTAGSFDIFYKVRNQYESYVDKSTLLPYFYTENRKEGGYRHSDNVTFDHEGDKITADKGVFQFKGKVFDFVSAYYFA